MTASYVRGVSPVHNDPPFALEAVRPAPAQSGCLRDAGLRSPNPGVSIWTTLPLKIEEGVRRLRGSILQETDSALRQDKLGLHTKPTLVSRSSGRGAH